MLVKGLTQALCSVGLLVHLTSLILPFPSADEIQAIASMIEKQAQIVVKPKEVSKEESLRKAALLAQYAEVTDEEEYPFYSKYSEILVLFCVGTGLSLGLNPLAILASFYVSE